MLGVVGINIVFLLLVSSGRAAAQATPVNSDRVIPRPKVGLVLSGGGARGFAHIGVLKVLKAVAGNNLPQ